MADLSHLDGHGWEDWLSACHARYRDLGLADVRRQEPPVVSYRARRVRTKKAGLPDFAGLLADGRRVVIEAKCRGDGNGSGRAFSLPFLEPHQAAALEAEQRAGSLVFVALLLLGVRWWIRWEDLRLPWTLATTTDARGRLAFKAPRSIGPDWLQAHARPMPDDGWIGLIDPLRIDRTPDRSGSDR